MSTKILLGAVLLGLTACSSGGGAAEPSAGSPTPPPEPTATVLAKDSVDLLFAPDLTPDLPGYRKFDPRTARLEGPHFAGAVTAVARVTGTVPTPLRNKPGPDAEADAVKDAEVVTAPGHELLLVELAAPASVPGTPSKPRITELRVEIVAGPVTRSVPANGDLTGGVIAASIPTGTRPVLRITDDGRAQSLDLTTGRRGADAVAGYYPVVKGEWETKATGTTGLTLSGPGVAGIPPGRERMVGIQLQDLPGRLEPWIPKQKWAKKGRGWLVLETEFAYGRSQDQQDTVVIPPSCFTLTGPDGTRYPLSGPPLTLNNPTLTTLGESTLIADVPASLRQVTVTFRFCGTITLPKGEVSYSVYTNPTQVATFTLR